MIEHALVLVGATAIEDGVPQTTADLKVAEIGAWLVAGGKLRTAIGA